MVIRKLALLFAVSVIVLAGCGEDVVVKRMKPEPPTADGSQSVEDITDELVAYKPPFPSHVALFEPKNKTTRPTPVSTVNAAGTDGETSDVEPEIELVGFGAVDTQHALLMIDGRLEALRVGEKYRNVRVLKIAPPLVHLRVAGQDREANFASRQDG